MADEQYVQERKIRRVLYSGQPRGVDYRNAQAWVNDIRSRLGHIRGELEDVGRIEALFRHDRRCNDVAGALSLAIIALHVLVEGERSFEARAERVDELWERAAARPDDFVIREGDGDWEWRPLGIFERGGGRRG